MKGTSQVTYVTMVPRVGNETLRPLGFGPCFGRKLQTKKLMMYSPGDPFIMVEPGSDVMGCRRPTDGVFTYVSSDTSHAGGVNPVATPRGRSVSFPTRGTMVTYVPEMIIVMFLLDSPSNGTHSLQSIHC